MNSPSPELMDLGMEESHDLMNRIRETLTNLEDDTGETDFNTQTEDIFRYAHTLNGVSKTIGLQDVAEISGNIESFFKEARNSESAGDDPMFYKRVEALFSQLDEAIRDMERDQI